MESIINSRKIQYDYDNWLSELDKVIHIRSLTIKSSDFDGYTLIRKEPIWGIKFSYSNIYRNKNNDKIKIEVTVIPLNSIDDSKEYLIRELSTYTNPIQLPSFMQLGIQIGDVGFGSKIDDQLLSSVFIKGNVVVKIRNIGLEDADIGNFLSVINEKILDYSAE